MKVEQLLQMLGAEFCTGVPDSQLKPLCDYLVQCWGMDPARHVIAPNEGSCAAIAAGYHLATGKVPIVYLQNSGLGNLVNPMLSLLHPKVYGIPCQLIIGWRGEPGVHDEPQHLVQGSVTLELLETLEIPYLQLTEDTTEGTISQAVQEFQRHWRNGTSTALVVRKNALSWSGKGIYQNPAEMTREEILSILLEYTGDDPIVATTGKTSRELFELRRARGQDHSRDFLTVGSMGHCASIATGIALQQSERKVWCFDGDGAMLMHMGILATIGQLHPQNLIHVVINNAAHESVGGMPTVAGGLDLPQIASGCGYATAASVKDKIELREVFVSMQQTTGPHFLEIYSRIGSRSDLGRPTVAPQENKRQFQERLLQSR